MKNTKALVLLNLGAARSKKELEEFLTNMFNDRDILTVKNDFLRSLISKLITSNRLDNAWSNYEQIGGKSPMYDITNSIVDKLQEKLPDIFVTYAMRYTSPRAVDCIKELKEKGIDDIILFPLFPQYSTTTTKTGVEEFVNICMEDFTVKIIKPFYKENTFIDIVCNEIVKTNDNNEDVHLIFSAHGLPQKIIDNGDNYEKQIEDNVNLIEKKIKEMDVNFKSISLAYQSKIGPLKWITPSLTSVIEKHKNSKVLIYPLSFMIDNSETNYELSIEYAELAKKIGISEYKVCKCPNDNTSTINFISNLATKD